ncbi:MAG: LiaF transmembrane domain-containing protein [Faecalibacillus sp.]
MKKFEKILFGIVLISIGVILGLNALNITDIDIFFDGWWTLLIIIPCFLGLFMDKDKSGNLIGLFIGIVLFLACQNIIDFEIVWKLIVPFILIVIGFSIIFKNTFRKNYDDTMKNIYKNSHHHAEYNAIFSGKEIEFNQQLFEGATLNSVFGSLDLDLRNAHFTQDVVIEANAIFGGINIYIDDQINVKINATSVFGGIDNHHKNVNIDSKITVYMNMTCVFGGIDIK